MEFTSPFLGTEGRTATSANHLCNVAKEHYQHLEKMLTNQSLVTKTVSIVGQGGPNILINGITDLSPMQKALKEIAQCKALIAYFREGIKAKENLKKTIDACSYLKENIEEKTNFKVFHKDKRGINVIIETEDPKSLSYKLRHEFVLDSHGMITKCPNYNRLKEKAVALEIKNLDIGCLSQDNLDEIIKTLKCFDNN